MNSSRRGFIKTSAGVGATLALGSQLDSGIPRSPAEFRTFFFNLSHEQHEGHTYSLVMGRRRYGLKPLRGRAPVHSPAYQRNRFAQMLPSGVLTHMVENVEVSNTAVQLTYVATDQDSSTGTWKMSGMLIVLPSNSFDSAYQQATKILPPGSPLMLSAKRRKYGLPPVASLQDLLDEQDVVDTTEFASTLVNLHAELICADPPTAAHIQTNHIKNTGGISDLSDVLQTLGPALPAESTAVDDTNWGTLLPYTDSNGSPIKNKFTGLILYDTQWNPKLKNPWIADAMKQPIQTVKNDATLGADVTSRSAGPDNGDLLGKIWYRNDGITSEAQPTGAAVSDSSNVNYTLSNITPNYNGYSVSLDATDSGSITLTFKNWYVRWLGLFIQFLDTKGHVVRKSMLPSGISTYPAYDTDSNALFLGTVSPEFTILGIPVTAASAVVPFDFPTSVASSARVLGSGLGYGTHTFPDTETVGVVMTSIFNLSLPALLLAIGIGAQIDAFYKTVVIPSVKLIVDAVLRALQNGTQAQIVSTFWHDIVSGITGTGALGQFIKALLIFIGESEAEEAILDAIPLVGAILQAVGALVTIAQIDETSIEVGLSPWTYEYHLMGTYDLSVSVEGFPADAVYYKATAILDNGTPRTQSGSVSSPLKIVFSQLPLGGGSITVTVGLYAEDQKTQVAHGSTTGLNTPSGVSKITVMKDKLPIGPGVTYHHQQKTALDDKGNHVWTCAPAPAAPSAPPACDPNPGELCALRKITHNPTLGYIGYAWQSYSTAPCISGMGQLDQIANIAGSNGSNNNAQGKYATIPCALNSAARLVYDPLGRPNSNYYIDSNNILRRIHLNPPSIADPRGNHAWGKFNLTPDDLLLHPSGAIVTISAVTNRMESLKLPTSVMSDSDAEIHALANLHGGLGSRPGLFNAPTVTTITAEGVILILEAGNNRIHAVDAVGNPVRLFNKQPQPYFLNFSATGGSGTFYLDIAVEFSGFIYVLSSSASIYRLDIYNVEQSGTNPISTTSGFYAAKVTVDYWRNVYSLNYEVLTINGSLPTNGVTEPSISEWIATTPPPCDVGRDRITATLANGYESAPPPKRPLRRRFWA